MYWVDSPHGHVASIYNHWSEASGRLPVWSRSGLAGTWAAASGHQLGTVRDAFVAGGASVAGLYQLLQDVVGLGVMAEALQHPQDVTVRVSQLKKSLHFGMLLLVVHRGRWFRMLPRLCLLSTVCLGNPPRLLIVVPQHLHGNSLCFGTVDRCQKGGGGGRGCHCKHKKSQLHFFFSQSDTTSWLQAQEQTLADVMPVKKAPVTHTLTQRGSRGSALIPGLILPPVSFGSVSKTNMNGTDVSLMLLASPNSTHVLLLFMETPWTSLLRVKTVEWLNHHFFHFISPTKQHKALTGCYTRNNENTKQATERACRVYKKSPS